MPIYMYRCGQCNETHEALQKVSDAPLTTCVHCGAEALRKVIAPVGIIFKGSGFHKNDYSGSAGKGSSGAASTSTTPAASEGGDSSATQKSSDSGSTGGSGGSTGGDGGGSGPAASGSNQVA